MPDPKDDDLDRSPLAVATRYSDRAAEAPPSDPDFLSMLANNPHGWGNGPPIPQPVQEQEPWNFPGEARNLADRQSDPVETPLAESLSPTMGAYGAGQTLGESLNRFAAGDLKGSAETALPLLLGIFAGPGARTADMTMLAKAKELAAAKAPREQIWGDTGWFQGPDQKWRFEIPDDKARWNPEIAANDLDVGSALHGYKEGFGRSPLLGDLFEHPELYKAYPGTEKIGLHPIKDLNARGSYDNAGNIGLNTLLTSDDTMKSTALHEIMHAIQQREGFSPGAGYDTFTQQNEAKLARDALSFRREMEAHPADLGRAGRENAVVQQYHQLGAMDWLPSPEARNIAHDIEGNPTDQLEQLVKFYGLDKHTTPPSPQEMYRRTAGEVEARNVPGRLGLPSEGRPPPWETQDVLDDQQIVRSPTGGGVQMSMKPKIPPYPGDYTPDPWWHGSFSGDLRGGTSGLHLGTQKAAEEALTARIGYPAEGAWDGSRDYGSTLLAGQKTMRDRGIFPTGRNVHAPEQDYYAHEHPEGQLTHGNGDVADYSNKPSVRQYEITGGMTNNKYQPHPDFKANGYMKAALKKGNAKSGYFYKNEGEDEGSISAVVPNGSHVRPYPGDVPMQGSSVSGTTPEQVDPSRLLPSHDVEAGSPDWSRWGVNAGEPRPMGDGTHLPLLNEQGRPSGSITYRDTPDGVFIDGAIGGKRDGIQGQATRAIKALMEHAAASGRPVTATATGGAGNFWNIMGFRREGHDSVFDADQLAKLQSGELNSTIWGHPRGYGDTFAPTYGPGAEALRSQPTAPPFPGDTQLPMDELSRMARAREMGFDVDRPLYHGTTSPEDFSEFKPSSERYNELGQGAYFFNRPDAPGMGFYSGEVGRVDNGRIIPAYAKKGDYFDFGRFRDTQTNARANMVDEAVQRFIEHNNLGYKPGDEPMVRDMFQHALATRGDINGLLKQAGYVGGFDKYSQMPDQTVIFDPKNVRSKFATFDPEKKDSADIGHANGGAIGRK